VVAVGCTNCKEMELSHILFICSVFSVIVSRVLYISVMEILLDVSVTEIGHCFFVLWWCVNAD